MEKFGKVSSHPANADLWELIAWHFHRGTKSDLLPDQPGMPWNADSFSEATYSLGSAIEPRTIRGWFDRRRPSPRNVPVIIKILFGDNPAFREWRLDFQRAYSQVAPQGRSTSSNSSPAPTLLISDTVLTELGLKRAFLEALAAQFGGDNLDDPDHKLMDFLKSKAAEYRELKARFVGIEHHLIVRSNTWAAAQQALDRGDFQEAETLLESAEAQYERTAASAVSQLAEIRASRGDVALLSGNVQAAFDHYAGAIASIAPFNSTQELLLRMELAQRIIESVQRSPAAVGYKAGELSLALLTPAYGSVPHGTTDWAIFEMLIARAKCLILYNAPLEFSSTEKEIIESDRYHALALRSILSQLNSALEILISENKRPILASLLPEYMCLFEMLYLYLWSSGDPNNHNEVLHEISSYIVSMNIALPPTENYQQWHPVIESILSWIDRIVKRSDSKKIRELNHLKDELIALRPTAE